MLACAGMCEGAESASDRLTHSLALAALKACLITQRSFGKPYDMSIGHGLKA